MAACNVSGNFDASGYVSQPSWTGHAGGWWDGNQTSFAPWQPVQPADEPVDWDEWRKAIEKAFERQAVPPAEPALVGVPVDAVPGERAIRLREREAA